MLTTTPSGPWDNPVLADGVYDATVVELIETDYGEYADPMLKIIFRLSLSGRHFITHLYFPRGSSQASNRRLWRFCSCVGLDRSDVHSQPDAFQGRSLRLVIENTDPEQTGQDHAYADVKLFLPPTTRQDTAQSKDDCSDPFGVFPCNL